MFVLGKRRRWEELPLCLEQPRQEKRLQSSLCEFLQGLLGTIILKNWWRTQLAGSRQACYASLLFYDPVEYTDLTCWISCSQLSQDGTAVFLNLSGAVRCGCSFSGMCCTAHRDPDTSAFCPGQRHCGCGNLWLLQPTTFSVQNTWLLTVRTKHDGKEVLNQQARLHQLSLI